MLKLLGTGLGGLLTLVGGLVGYAGMTADRLLAFPDTPLPAMEASEDPAVIERGRYLAHGPAHCNGCHSTDDRQHFEKALTAPLHGGLPFAMGPLGTRYAANLTSDAATGLGELSDGQIARAIRTGVTHDGELSILMRLSAADLSDEDTVAVLSYLRSLEPVRKPAPKGQWALFGKVLITYAFPAMTPRLDPAPKHVPAGEAPSVGRGRYLAKHVMLCASCHTKTDPMTFEKVGPEMGGSLPDPSHGEDSDMEFVAPNLTSHPTGITGRLDEDAFVKRMRGGRAHASSIMPWEGFQNTTEADLRSVYRYLKSLPPVDHDTGPTYRKIGSADE